MPNQVFEDMKRQFLRLLMIVKPKEPFSSNLACTKNADSKIYSLKELRKFLIQGGVYKDFY